MKTKVFILLSLILAFIAGGVTSFIYKEPRVVTIKEYDLKYNTITKNINDISCKEAKEDLYCFYTGFPTLSIKHLQDEEYILSSSLCERQWHKRVDINVITKRYRNMIIGGVMLDNSLNRGLNVQYYRFFGRMGVGGGVSMSQGSGQITGGVAWLW